ncbi:MAG: LPS export ABC transporter periplasmic protein LptC [Bdellovibrionales bacterium]
MKARLLQFALTAAFVVLLVQVVLIAPSHIRDAEHQAALIPAPPPPPSAEVDQSMNGMHMIETQDGKKEWELWSEKARSLKAKELLELDMVKAILFSDKGLTYTVTGKIGTVQVKTKNLRVEGDVVTRSSSGYTFRTPNMDYVSDGRSLQTEERVEVIGPKEKQGPGLYLTGQGLQAKLSENVIEIHRDVRARKQLDDGKMASIRSHRARLTSADRTAQFFGEVVLDVENMRITGPAATFEYDEGSQRLKAVNFSGGARVSDAEKWATAQNVRIDFDKNRFVFRGAPRVVQNNDELRGEEIVFLDGGKRVQVRGARAKVDEKRLEKAN